MRCCPSVKCLLHCINGFFALIGCIVLGVGAYATARFSKYEDIIGDVKIPVSMIIFGFLILFVAVLGIVGVKRASSTGDQRKIKSGRCILWIYALLIFLIFIMQLACGAVLAVFVGGVSDISKEGGCDGDSWCENVDEKVTKYVTCAFNITCGNATSCVDTSLKLSVETTRDICKDFGITHDSEYCANAKVFKKQLVDEFVAKYGRPVTGVFISFAMLELFAFIFTICQLCSRGNKHTKPDGEVLYGSLGQQKPSFGQSYFVTATPSDNWNCASCTYENHVDFNYCAMCSTKRPDNNTVAYGSNIAGV